MAQAVLHKAGHIDPIRGEVEVARLDARHVKDDVDQFQQLTSGFVDLCGKLQHLRACRIIGRQQSVGEADHGVQRRAQLVAHRREET